jgi:hypothetical protein
MPAKTLAQLIPGCTFSSGAWTIPASALNAYLTTPMSTSTDNGAALVYALLEALYQQTQSGILVNSAAAVSIDAKNSTKSVYETTPNTFTSVSLVSYLVSFPFTTGGSTESVGNLTQI